MTVIEPEPQDQPQAQRKTYHAPEFQAYGAVGDLTRTAPPVTPVNYDSPGEVGYVNSFPTT